MKEQINKVFEEKLERDYLAQYAKNYYGYSILGAGILILAAWKAGELVLLFWEWLKHNMA